MNIQMKAKRQDGFTIIELVVVILLLGILAATALPRFMDVTDEAHDAVVRGVQGSLNSGAAMFRATWVATGQPSASAVDYGAVTAQQNFANNQGYPIGTDATRDASTCSEIFTGIQQPGGLPTILAAASGWDNIGGAGDAATLEGLIEAQSANADFVAVAVFDSTGGTDITGDSSVTVADTVECRYFYTGQFKSGTSAAPQDIPYLILDLTTGNTTIGATEFTLEEDA